VVDGVFPPRHPRLGRGPQPARGPRRLNVPQADTLRLADQMASAWVAFAATGNPNNAKTPNWPAYDLTKRTTMVWDSESKAADDPRGAFREFWANRAPGVGER